jgi:NIMA (never in mitosis gene a)-related kinase
MNEAKVLAMLDHPSIVRHYKSILEDNALKLVMEYVPGGTLFEFIQNRSGDLIPEKVDNLFLPSWFFVQSY